MQYSFDKNVCLLLFSIVIFLYIGRNYIYIQHITQCDWPYIFADQSRTLKLENSKFITWICVYCLSIDVYFRICSFFTASDIATVIDIIIYVYDSGISFSV